MQENKVALVTGGAQRIGAALCRHLHDAGYNVLIHYRNSAQAASELAKELNNIRPKSAHGIPANLLEITDIKRLIQAALQPWQRLDIVVNNASSFYPTAIGNTCEDDWNDLIGSNMKAPFFIAQAVAEELAKQQGCIINIVDVHGQRPLKSHSVYCAAKAGLAMLTRSLAIELAPNVRVNGIAPGAILWPATEPDAENKQKTIDDIVLQRLGDPLDIAKTVLFLARDADYITGQIIAVDGGRSL
ncbi:pteridine reductase [Gammaproteobacteria bacterium AH-315-M22]|nr:pteridine reductase [Gammaproteobacteria bacterium AH-315-M22]